jgi:hypothetical protein
VFFYALLLNFSFLSKNWNTSPAVIPSDSPSTTPTPISARKLARKENSSMISTPSPFLAPIPVTIVLEEKGTKENAPSDYQNIYVGFRDNSPTVTFTLSENPPTICFKFPIEIKNNFDDIK